MVLDRGQIQDYLVEVARALPPGDTQHTLLVVGGSLLAWHDLRAATADVDSVARLDDALRTAAHRVARMHDLAPDWLNDASAAFRPDTLTEDTCTELYIHPRLRVLGAPLDQVFLMKVHAARAPDYSDLVRLWPLAGFVSPEAAVEEYWKAYPHADHDEYLTSWITEIARRSALET